MRRETDFFGDNELELVYMARRLNDALELEASLNEAGLDYLVETGSYTGGFLMRRELTGAFFYVSGKDVGETRRLLEQTRRRPYSADQSS